MNTTVETFMQYDYVETRDLLKAFITLISATLVFSLTFVDKIAGFSDHTGARRLVFGAWTSFFLSLAFAGASIVLIATAAGCFLYGGIVVFDCTGFGFAQIAWAAGLVAGALYLLGLLLLTLAARRSYLQRHSEQG